MKMITIISDRRRETVSDYAKKTSLDKTRSDIALEAMLVRVQTRCKESAEC